MNAKNQLLLKTGYGGFFTILVPLLLAFWAIGLDRTGAVSWPLPVPAWLGALFLAGGAILMAVGMLALWTHGKGLPMNAFPPEKLVERSVYRLVPHPIYVGFCLAVFGTAAAFHSPAGFWIVGPLSICAVWALVFGYEAPALRRRLGSMKEAPLFALPGAGDTPLSRGRTLALIPVAWAPWAITYALFSAMPAPARAEELRFAFEWNWVHPESSLWIYSLAYPFIALAPLVCANGRKARSAIAGIWLASLLGFAWMLLLPGKAALLQPAGDSLPWLLTANRALDADWLACPSFHTAWAFVAAGLYGRRWPAWRIPLFAFALLVAVSCVLSGSHALIDIAGGMLLAGIALRFEELAAKTVQLTEKLANSWGAWRIGRLRIISHIVWTALSAFIGSLIALALAGPGYAWPFTGIMVAGVFSALAFGRLVEGRHLSRPFGYFGFLGGCLLGLAIMFSTSPADTALLAAATACAAPFAQAIGRGRCIVQGCCHGRPGEGSWTIRVRNPQSRVVCVAAFAGEPVYATQLLSAVFNLGIGATLLLAWRLQASTALVCGLYLILTALARFAEEGWRGEPQTPSRYGLSLYQWICVSLLPVGMAVALVPAPVARQFSGFGIESVVAAAVVALIMSVMMSTDWPESRLPLSRLAPPG